MNAPTTLAELLAPYRPSAVADAVGVTADTARLWRSGRSAPSADKISSLAAFLRVNAQIVVDAIAAQKVTV